MAHSLSAKKRVRQNAKARGINRGRKSMVRTQIKHFEDALETGDITQAEQQYNLLIKKIDKIASTSSIHKNTASRIKSRMARKLDGLKAKS